MECVVPEEGLEPSQGYPYRILSPARLPFHHSGNTTIDNGQSFVMQGQAGMIPTPAPLKEQLPTFG
jgi:hypothetical protein